MCFTFPLWIGVQWSILPQSLSLPTCGFEARAVLSSIRRWKIHEELKGLFMILTVEAVLKHHTDSGLYMHGADNQIISVWHLCQIHLGVIERLEMTEQTKASQASYIDS